jgi:hypothetical protein
MSAFEVRVNKKEYPDGPADKKRRRCFTLNFGVPKKIHWNLLAKCLRYVISYKYTTSFPFLDMEVGRK